jgi:translocation and assembly module TamB
MPNATRRRSRWKVIFFGAAAGLLAVIAVAAITVAVLLHSAGFHRYVLRTAERELSEQLNTQVGVRDFALRFSGISPTVELYDIAISGAPPFSNSPLLQVDHLRIGVQIVSLFHKKWYLQNVAIDHPVVHVLVAQDGANNLPHLRSSGQNQTSVFDLGVRHATLDRGEIYYNDRQNRLDADLRNVDLQSRFNSAQQRYSGTLSYRDGHLRFDQYAPVTHNLDGQFDATPSALTVVRAELAIGGSQLVLTATLQDYSHPQIQGHYEGTLDGGEFRRILENQALPGGVIRLTGGINYRYRAGRPLLDTLTMNGDLDSRALVVQQQAYRAELRDLGAHFTLDHGNLEVRELRAYLLGGELTGSTTVRDISGAAQSRLQASVRGLSLDQLKQMVQSPSPQSMQLAGTLDATTEATWDKALDHLVAKADATIHARIIPAQNSGGANTLPVDGVIHARYLGAGKQLSLQQSYLQTTSTSLKFDGTVSNRAILAIRVQSGDLHELETVANLFTTPNPEKATQPLSLFGSASFTGSVTGSTNAPRLTGDLTAQNLRLKGSAWRRLQAHVEASPSEASLQQGELIPADRGHILFNLTAGLKQWAFSTSSPVQLTLNASQIDVATLAKAANLQTPVTGTLSANLALHGNELNPIGRGTVSLTQACISGQPLQSVSLAFQGDGNEAHANLIAKMNAGSAHGVLTYFPKRQTYEAQFQLANLQLGQLQLLKAKKLNLTGIVSLNADGRGSLKNPGLQATIRIPQLKVQDQTISGVTVQATLADHVANVVLNSEAVNTYVRGRGTINLTGDYEASATLDTQVIPLQPLVALYAPSQAGNVTGQTELHGSLRGPLKKISRLEAHITIPSLAVNYRNQVQIGAVSPIHLDFANGVLDVQRSALRGTDTDLQFQGSIPIQGNAPVSLLLQGTVDLGLAQLFDPDFAGSGQLQFNINSYGQRSDPNVEGQVKIVNANFATAQAPIGLQNGNGVLSLTKDRLNITQFAGTIGGGAVTASGSILYRPSVQFDLALKAEGIRMLYPETVRETVDADLALTGTPQAAQMGGRVKVNQVAFTPDFDLMSLVTQLTNGGPTAPAQGFSQNLQLNFGVQSTSNVHVVSKTLSVEGSANLRVTGTAGTPVILGRVNLTGGDLVFRGNRYVLQESTLDFVNPLETEPVVNIAADTTIQQYNIHLRFQGPANQLRTEYSSDPALAAADIINLLAFGKTTEASAANPTSTNFEAESAIASGVASQVTSRLQKIAGISQISVDPLLGCDQQNPGACLAIQQRVTSNLFVTFATDVTSFQRQTIQGEYQITPRVSISGTRDQNGGFGFDARIKKTW